MGLFKLTREVKKLNDKGGREETIFGNTYFVDYRNGLDTQDGLSAISALKTLSAAYGKCTSNNNDVIYIDGDSTVVETAIINWTKSRITVKGIQSGRPYGCAAKVSMGITTAATDIALINVTGVRNQFHDIKFKSDNTKDESLYTFIDGGEYTYMENCEVYKSTDMDETDASEFVCNADSPIYKNCTFGSLATARSGAVIRANVLFTKEISASGKVTRDATFEGCNFWINASNTANRFMYGANAADIERIAVIKDCMFINNGASSAVPAQNVAFGSSLSVGSVLLNRCSSVNAATAMSTTTGVFVDGGSPTATTTGISVQAS